MVHSRRRVYKGRFRLNDLPTPTRKEHQIETYRNRGYLYFINVYPLSVVETIMTRKRPVGPR